MRGRGLPRILAGMTAGTRHLVTADHRHHAAARAILAEQRQWLAGILGTDIVDLQPDAVDEYRDPVRFYRRPRGRLLLARADGRTVGCVGVRRITGDTAQLKRMYVRPRARGLSAGGALLRAAIDAAAELGVERLVLETKLPEMATAVALYRSAGFVERADAPRPWCDGLLHLERPMPERLIESA
jgi:GNAT superfamily N-acetyltransferase